MKINKDCKYFKGYKPCIPNKKYGMKCDNCVFYRQVSNNILIIKLAGIGDVIRTTPILTRLKLLHPDSKIYWLTEYPEVLPNIVDYKLKFDFRSIEIVKSINFDKVYNLDKSLEACALVNNISGITFKGFQMDSKFGVIKPFDSYANHKYLTGIFDDFSKENKKHYVEEIFEICDIGKFGGEEYLLPKIISKECFLNPNANHNSSEICTLASDFKEGKTVIGLNTGYGDRWRSREWACGYWTNLAEELIKKGYEVVILGGEKEHNVNKYAIAPNSGAKYYGTFPIDQFVSIVNLCNLVVSQITSVAHIAIGLKKKVVLMNNIFNKHEFYLYGLGKIIEPDIKCDCYYSHCKNNCMEHITVDKVLQTIEELI